MTDIRQTCGTCKHRYVDNLLQGFCSLNPPTLILTPGKRPGELIPASMHPPVAATYTACSHWASKILS